jgi:hypothetical protein
LLDFKGLKLLLKSSAKADVQILNPLSGKDFGGIRAFWIWFFRMPECVPQDLSILVLFGVGMKTRKPVNLHFTGF